MTTFLIADDSPDKTSFLLEMLKRAHWYGTVLTAMTSEDAIDTINQSSDIAAAFIDYYIPSSNGPAIIRALKKKFPNARVALVSSADNESNTAQAIAAGAERSICTSRPVDEVERSILATLDAWKVAE